MNTFHIIRIYFKIGISVDSIRVKIIRLSENIKQLVGLKSVKNFHKCVCVYDEV